MVALLAYFAAVTGWLAMRRTPLLHPAMVCTLVWLAAVTLAATGIIRYSHNSLAFTTVLFIAGCHTAMLIGIWLVQPEPRHPRVVFAPGPESTVLVGAASAYVALQFLATLMDGHIPIIGTATQIDVARRENLAGELSLPHQIARIFSYPAMGYVALLPVFWKHRKKGHVVICAAAALALVDHAFVTAHRSILVYTGLMLAAVYLAVYRVSFTRSTVLGIVGTFAVIHMGSTFYIARNPHFENNPSFYIARSCQGGYVAGPLSGEASTEALALSSCYLTAPMRTLDDYLANPAISGTLGLYNSAIFISGEFSDLRGEIASHYYYQGRNINPWATSMRDFWIDFGYFAVLAYIPLGMALAALTRRAAMASEAQTIRYAGAVVAAVMVPLISPLVIRHIVYPIIATWLVTAAANLALSKRRERRRVRA